MSNLIDIWTASSDTFAIHRDSGARVVVFYGRQEGQSMTRNEIAYEGRTEDGAGADVDALASQVISVLCDRQATTTAGARRYLLDYLMRAVRDRSDFEAAQVMAELRGHRLTPDAIIDTYVPITAEELGRMWIADELDFAGVTVSALRLQALLGEASSELTFVERSSPHAYGAMIVVPLGEQHFLGAHVVAAQLRRLGVAVSISFCEKDTEILSKMESHGPEMVLFSCARPEALEVIAGTVKKIRQSVHPTPVLAVGGVLRGDPERMQKETNVDIVSWIAKDVVGFCAKRLKALAKE